MSPRVIVPELGFSSATISLPIVVLPQPDSPTSPKVVPAGTEKVTSDTAWTLPTLRCITPEVMGNSFTKLVIWSSGATPSAVSTATSTVRALTWRRPSAVTSSPAATTMARASRASRAS